MTDVLHVSPDLVSTARLQAAFHQCGVAKVLNHPPMGDGRLAYFRVRRKDSHALTVTGVATYVALYASFALSKVPPHQGMIAAMGIVVEELYAKFGLGLGRLGHNEQSAVSLSMRCTSPTLGSFGS